MAFRVERYDRLSQSWIPYTLEPFDTKEDAESHRLQILNGGDFDIFPRVNPGFFRVKEFETEADRRRRLFRAWREQFPMPAAEIDREREAVLFGLVATEALERAVGLTGAAREPSADEIEACRIPWRDRIAEAV